MTGGMGLGDVWDEHDIKCTEYENDIWKKRLSARKNAKA